MEMLLVGFGSESALFLSILAYSSAKTMGSKSKKAADPLEAEFFFLRSEVLEPMLRFDVSLLRRFFVEFDDDGDDDVDDEAIEIGPRGGDLQSKKIQNL